VLGTKATTRESLIERLEDEGREDLAGQLRKCGQKLVLRAVCCGDARLGYTRCRHKWCPSCARGIAAERAERLSQIVKTFRWPLFVTLTMKNVEDLTGDAVRELRRAFGRWRRMKANELITGGIASIEVTNIGNGWHPHLHMVIDCEWLGPQRLRPLKWEPAAAKAECYRLAKLALENTWAKALRQPMGVMHAKRCTAEGIVKEVVKYSVKGSDLIESAEPIGPLIDCLKKTRLVTTFGTAHGFKFTKPPRELAACECGACLNGSVWLPQELYLAQFGSDQWRVAWVRAEDL